MKGTMDERTEMLEIDLQKLLMAYLRKWWLILLCGVLVAVGAFIYTTKFVTPLYRASVTIYVNNSRSNQQIDYVSGSNLAASQQLVSTYSNIIKSDTVLEKVVEKSNLNYSADQLRKIMSAAQVDKTELFNVYIVHPDPEMAADIANAVAAVAPGEIEKIVEGSSTKIIDYAKVPTEQYSPNPRKNTIVGGLIGCFLAVAYLTLVFLLDVRIKDYEDLTSLFDLPVLGQIPNMQTVSASSHKKYGYETEPVTSGKGGKR